MSAPAFGRCVASDHDGLHVQDDGCDNWQPQRAYSPEPSNYELLLAEVQAWRTRAETAEMLLLKLTKLWADFASQEMYGEHLRAGLEEQDFDAWEEAHDIARTALSKAGAR